MTSHYTLRLVLTALALAVASPSFAQQAIFEWQQAAGNPQNWNVAGNWLFSDTGGSVAVVPDVSDFDGDSARISNGGTAQVTGDVPDVALIDVFNGIVDIQPGGILDAVVSGDGIGNLTVGGAGTVRLSGNGMLSTAGSLSNGGTVELTGNGASLSVGGNFSSTGATVAANITNASSHSTISVTGQASLGGTLNVDFSGGVTPAVGNTWNLFDASAISGGYENVNVTSGLPTGMALFFQTAPGGSNGALGQVTADVQLKLSINPRTGVTSIKNLAAGQNEQIDGYLIKSTANSLVPGNLNGFNSQFGSDWTPSNLGTNSLGELNLVGDDTIAGDSSVSLGAIYDFNPTAIGQAEPTPVFEYRTPEGFTRTGLVEFEGPRNNIVLLVDPATGDAAIQNQSTFDVEIDGYLVTSASNALDPAGWDSLETSEGNGWTESNQAANHIGELNLTGMLDMSGGSSPIPLGSLFDFDGSGIEQDLDFAFHIAGGDTIPGIVQYGEFSLNTGDADFNSDNDVDGEDFLTWQRNVGNPSGFPIDMLQPFGDANSDESIDGLDLQIWESQYGNGALSGLSATTAVPEPTSIGLLFVALTSLACSQRRKGSF